MQRILRAQSSLNTSRKQILQDRAHDTLAYAEYRATLRNTLDRPISTAYTKLLRASAGKSSKKNKHKASLGAAGAAEEKLTAGGIPLELPPELMERVRLRKRFVDTVGAMLKESSDGDEEGGSRAKSLHREIAMVHFPTTTLLPPRSIYEGVEEEVEREIGWPFRPVIAGVYDSSEGHASGSGQTSNGASGAPR